MSSPLPPLVEPAAELTRDEVARYSRHLIIPDLGLDGQKRLKNARVLVIGAGGLGSPTLLYLAAAGVGTIGIVEFDVVDESNLQRQIIHGQSDIGRSKAESAKDSILEVNPLVEVILHEVRLEPDLVQDHLDERVHLEDRVLGALGLGAADVGLAVDDLALQVGLVDDVELDDADRADSGGREVQQCRRAETTGSDHQHPGVLQPFLTVQAEVGNDQVTAVAGDLVAGQFSGWLDQRWQR